MLRWYKGIGRQAQECVIGVFISQITACRVKARGRRPNKHVYNHRVETQTKERGVPRINTQSHNDYHTGRDP